MSCVCAICVCHMDVCTLVISAPTNCPTTVDAPPALFSLNSTCNTTEKRQWERLLCALYNRFWRVSPTMEAETQAHIQVDRQRSETDACSSDSDHTQCPFP